MDSKPVIILGSGGHAKVLVEALKKSGRNIIGLTDPTKSGMQEYCGVKVLGGDEVVFDYSPDEIELVNGLGSIPGNRSRYDLDENMKSNGYTFTHVIHPSAVLAKEIVIGDGTQIMAGVVIQPGVRIGQSCIINTGVTVDHDCIIHNDCHLAPGVTLSGNVVVNEKTHIGTSASVIHGITIGAGCIIAAGATVYKNVPDRTKFIQLQKEHLEGIA